MKLTKKNYIHFLILSLFVILFYFILTKNKYLFGSVTDWKDQHFYFAEYFRNHFYSNHKIFPEFALNIGGGQNIFNFAYYGLFNPIILISYLLPFVNMMDFVIISSLIIVIISAFLFYKWLYNNNISSNICFITSFIFICASPLFFHSHRHIMFMSYMPFLILLLMSIDKYLKSNKVFFIPVLVSLLILTSYFYSVSALFVVVIYYLYKYFILNKFNLKDFLIKSLVLAFYIFIGILISAFYLLPVFSTILAGRVSTTTSLNILELFIPNLDLGYILYNSYSMGLTSIAIFTIIYLFSDKKIQNKILSIFLIFMLCIPALIFILNGTLYVNSKALIPFIPLMCYLISLFIKNIFENKIKLNIYFEVILLIFVFSLFNNNIYISLTFLVDGLLVLLAIYLIKYSKKIFSIMVCVISLICFIGCNFDDELYTIKDYQKDHNISIKNDINKIIDNDTSFYRINNNLSKLSTVNEIYDMNYYQSSLYSSTYNGNYNKFFTTIFNNEISFRNSIINSETDNLLFQIFMGEKYIVTNNNRLGYKLIDENDDYSIFENTYTLPIGYSSSKVLNYDEYEKFEYPYNVEALLKYIITNDNSVEYDTNIEEYDLNNILSNIKDIDYTKNDDSYYFELDEKKEINIPIELKDKILIITFDMEFANSCSDGDTYITINGIKNKLTCAGWKYHNKNYKFEYVLSDEELNNLNIIISKGKYEIKNIKGYTLNKEYLEEINSNIDELIINRDDIKDNYIKGNIDVNNDGYLIIKIPYDKGFKIKIDNEFVEVLNLNDGFIGTKISSGHHEVEITYNVPLFKIGKIISSLAIIFFLISLIVKKYIDFFLNIYRKYEEIINYIIIGGLTTIVSIGSYSVLSIIFHLHYQVSNILSWIFAVLFAYITNKLFVFKKKNTKNILYEIYQFFKYRVFSLLIDMGCMYVLIDILNLNEIVAKVIVQFIVVALNYVFSKLFIFKK